MEGDPKHPKRRKTAIGNIPYDVLREIFILCLPSSRYALTIRQPNPKLAPMLLCQVCSSWRIAALSSATLWSHLSFKLTLQPVALADIGYRWAVLRREISFLRRWRTLHGSIAPSLSFSIKVLVQCNQRPDHQLLAEGTANFILDYLSTAQYLDVDVFFWQFICDRIEDGYPIKFPNLHSLVRNQNASNLVDAVFQHSQMSIGNQPNLSPSALRRLCINGDVLLDKAFPAHWSMLTSISMSEVDISLVFWYDILREVPQLEHGYFNINHIECVFPITTIPNKCTHHRLATLFVELEDMRELVEFPLLQLFANLHLPVLRTLSLSSHAESWSKHLAFTELNAALASAPNITTLELRGDFLALGSSRVNMLNIYTLVGAEPIWMSATRLAHLQLEICHNHQRKPEEKLRNFVTHMFILENRWLSLAHAECTIRKITIVDRYLDKMEKFAMERIRLLRGKIQRVDFQITSDSDGKRAQEAWKEWGLKITS
ncbi:hypothetical protein BDN70DRAFT_939967 [Pholiota conissans]|uniref:F-box domain-containing protein n=1 Tax=Pholiota conissans TaxID=109636 RepID=A0A9P6CQF7_9AGAR|nr:hypothetical protein BDN70DRAFT_939967 [Pholiota conissans]